MSRHRHMKNLDLHEERNEFDDYGHSVDDESYMSAMSPSTAQFIYKRDPKPQSVSEYIPEGDEKDEDYDYDYEDDHNFQMDGDFVAASKPKTPKSSSKNCNPLKTPSLPFEATKKSSPAVEVQVSAQGDANDHVVPTTALPQRQPRNRRKQSSTDVTSDDVGVPGQSTSTVSDSTNFILSSGLDSLTVNITAAQKYRNDNLVGNEAVNGYSGEAVGNGYSAKPSANVTGRTDSRDSSRTLSPLSPGSGVYAKLMSTPSLSRPSSRNDLQRLDVTPKFSKSGNSTPRGFRSMSPAVDLPSKPRIKERPSGGKDMLNLVVIGHVDAGKSTLMGHLLCQSGNVNQRVMHKNKQESQKVGKGSFAYAWVLDETDEERERGVTMDIAQTRFETDSKMIVLLDAPGHKDFIPNMITGAAQADVALLVVNATRGEFETGFDQGGQTREHAMLIRSLGVSQLAVVVNKLDTVDWSQERYKEICDKLKSFLKQSGFGNARFVPASGLNGDNLTVPPTTELAYWYVGPTLLQIIDTFTEPSRSVDKPLRFCISDVFKSLGSGFTVSGKVETGAIQTSDRVLILPNLDSAQIKGVQTDDGGIDAGVAYAGDQAMLTITSVDINNVGVGHVICHPESRIPTVTRFQVRLVIFNITVPITKGFPIVIHYQCISAPAVISKLISELNKSTGEVKKLKPRCLCKHSSGIVELRTDRPICLELYSDCKELGRVTIRSGGKTLAAGMVVKLLQ